MRFIKISAVCIFIFCFASVLNAQEKQSDTIPSINHNKNLIYANAEFYLLGGGVAISYERFLFAAKKFDLSARGTYGRWAFSGGLGEGGADYGNLFKLSADMLFLKGDHHAEIDVGVMMLLNDEESGIQSVIPDLFVGYVYKKPGGHFMFKGGIGILGFLSIGMGYAF